MTSFDKEVIANKINMFQQDTETAHNIYESYNYCTMISSFEW
jgi:hypothetical protein